ncbi:MAG: hypothetical protein AAFU54_20660 [Chloroflexota bacterium]
MVVKNLSAPLRLRVKDIPLYALMLAVVVIVYGMQSYNIGFENGHHGWPSAHGLAIFSHVEPETRFVGHAQAFLRDDGRLLYDYFDRYPLFFGVFMRGFFTITDDLPTEIMIFRHVMNTIFLLTMFAAYRLVRLFTENALLAFGITVTAFSSFYFTYYKDQIHYDQPALLGMLWLLVAIGRFKLGRGPRWQVYAVAIAAVAMGRGYASLFVLAVWFAVDAITVLAGRGDPVGRPDSIPQRILEVFRLDAFRVAVLASVWASVLLGYNVYAEIALTGEPLDETSIYNSARRRLPFSGDDVLAGLNISEPEETVPPAENEYAFNGVGGFVLIQLQRVVLWFAPLQLGGEMGWRFKPYEDPLEFNIIRMAAAVALLAMAIGFAARQAPLRRQIALVTAFGGLAWVLFMINLSAKHIYVTMYSAGLTLVVWMALLLWTERSQWLVRGVVIVGMALFALSNWQARQTLNAESATLDTYTLDFDRVHEQMGSGDGVVYLAYGYYRPWCIINNNQCYVLGYYLSDYLLTEDYAASDYVLSPRPYHIAPQFTDAGESLNLLTPVRTDNVITYFMDRAQSQPRTAPSDAAPMFRFGEHITLQSWEFVGNINAQPCETVGIESWWLADDTPDANFNMQVVMVDENGGAVTEANSPLALVPTQLWEVGRFTFDQRPLTVPCDTPPGEYPLIMGVYDPNSLVPQPATDGDGNDVGNQVYLTTVFVQ